jgi:aspartate carbamoyltransferase catalytic subunit
VGAPVPSTPTAGGGWSSRALTGLQGVDAASLRSVLSRSLQIKNALSATGVDWPSLGVPPEGPLAGRLTANLFFEDSTRTRTSFAAAAYRAGARVLDLAGLGSSVSKGETLVDTALNVEAMGVSALVVRSRQSGVAGDIARAVKCAVINAGDGRHEHPTQGLLDILTFAEAHGRTGSFDLSGLTLAVVGDIASSRVARSAIAGMTALGATVVAVGPAGLAPASLASLGCRVVNDFDAVIPSADAVMMLRIQFERYAAAPAHGAAAAPSKSAAIASVREYRDGYALTRERLERMKAGAIVMHPGPINRGLEMDADAADGARSRVLAQVANGVPVRIAALEACVGAMGRS